MAAGVEEDSVAGSDFKRALAGEVSRARREQDEVRRNTANSKMSPGRPELLLASARTGWSSDVGVELRVELDVLGLDASLRKTGSQGDRV